MKFACDFYQFNQFCYHILNITYLVPSVNVQHFFLPTFSKVFSGRVFPFSGFPIQSNVYSFFICILRVVRVYQIISILINQNVALQINHLLSEQSVQKKED